MNFDRIKKLIKLANGNTNEHEANLAARTVCKLLDGHEFEGTPRQGSTVNVKPPSRYSNPFEGRNPFDIFSQVNKMYEEQEKRRKETEVRRTQENKIYEEQRKSWKTETYGTYEPPSQSEYREPKPEFKTYYVWDEIFNPNKNGIYPRIRGKKHKRK